MMKKGLYAILAALAVFALVMTGCDTGGGGNEETKSGENRLRGISIAGGSESTWGNSNDNKGSQDDVTSFINVNVSSASKADAEVSLRMAQTSFNGSVRVGKQRGTAAVEWKNYSATAKPKFELDDSDKLFVEVTAENGNKAYYGATILSGRDTGLNAILFEEETAVEEFGTSAATLAGVTDAGFILLPILQPSNGFNITVKASDSAATVSFGKADAAEATWTTSTAGGTATATIQFDDDEFLGVKVTAEKGQVAYYKISVELQSSMEIPYGTPKLYNTADNSDTTYIDPKWDDIEWIPISRWNRDETTDDFWDKDGNYTSTGKAKLYWDVDGLWLYVDVETKYYSTASEHNGSSIELFINEKFPTLNSGGYGDKGGQYRVSLDGSLSGDPTAAVDALRAMDRYKAFKTTTGYVTIFQAPWRFADTNPLTNNKSISLEIQINASSVDGSGRSGVLKWYNTTVNTYQNAAALAPGTLILPEGTVLPSLRPQITLNPQPKKVPLNTVNADLPEFKVQAASADGGTLSFQWFVADSASAAGTAVTSGVTSTAGESVFKPTTTITPTTAVKEFSIYCVVTNTKGAGTNTATSLRAVFKIYDPDEVLPEIELLTTPLTGTGTGWGNPSFDLLLPVDLDAYERMEIRYSVTGGVAPASGNNTDFYFGYKGEDNYNANGLVYNADGTVVEGVYLTISNTVYAGAFAGETITLKWKPQTEPNQGLPVTISSVKLIPKDD